MRFAAFSHGLNGAEVAALETAIAELSTDAATRAERTATSVAAAHQTGGLDLTSTRAALRELAKVNDSLIELDAVLGVVDQLVQARGAR